MQAELDALWAMVKATVSEAEKTGMPGLAGSAVKLWYTELYQRIGELAMRVLGRAAFAQSDVDGLPSREVVYKAMNSLSLTIAGSSRTSSLSGLSSQMRPSLRLATATWR